MEDDGAIDVHVELPTPDPEPEPAHAEPGTADLINHDRISELERQLREHTDTIAELRSQLDGKADVGHMHPEYASHEEVRSVEAELEPAPAEEVAVIEPPEAPEVPLDEQRYEPPKISSIWF